MTTKPNSVPVTLRHSGSLRTVAKLLLLAAIIPGCGTSNDHIAADLVAVPWAEFGGFVYSREWVFRTDGTLSIIDRQDASLPWQNGIWDLYGNRLTVQVAGTESTATVTIDGTKMEWTDTSSGRKRRFDYFPD